MVFPLSAGLITKFVYHPVYPQSLKDNVRNFLLTSPRPTSLSRPNSPNFPVSNRPSHLVFTFPKSPHVQCFFHARQMRSSTTNITTCSPKRSLTAYEVPRTPPARPPQQICSRGPFHAYPHQFFSARPAPPVSPLPRIPHPPLPP